MRMILLNVIVASYYVYEKTVIGRGMHGIVKLARYNNEQCVEKENRIDGTKFLNAFGLKSLQSEKILMSRLSHPGIVKYKGFVAVNKRKSMLFMEQCEKSFPKYFANKRIGLTEAIDEFRQVAAALYYMHSQSYCHLDIKPGNVLICKNRLKICDFSLSKTNCNFNSMAQGTLLYMSPELRIILKSKKRGLWNGYKADVYSLGQMFLQVLDNHHGIDIQKQDLMNLKYRKVDKLNSPKINFLLSEKYRTVHGINILFVNLLIKMIEPNPQRRITTANVMRDPLWFYLAKPANVPSK